MLLRVLRFFWKLLKWSFLLVIVLTALLVAINWRDEPLSDEARALLAEKPANVPDRENIYVAMAGLDAPEGADIFEAGRNRIEATKKTQGLHPLEVKHAADQDTKEKLAWQATNPPFDARISQGTHFPESVRAKKDLIQAALAANKILIQRYRSMQELPEYAAPKFFSLFYDSIDYQQMMKTQRFLLAQALLDMEAGNTGAGLSFFKKDLAMWRRVLEQKTYLLDTMFAVRSMTNDIYVLNLLLASPSTQAEMQRDEWRELLEPLSQEQYSLFSAVKGEIKFAYHTGPALKRWVSYKDLANQSLHFCRLFQTGMSECPVWRSWLEQNSTVFFLQPTATINHFVPAYQAQLKLTSLSWQDYLEQRDRILKPLVDAYDKPKIDWIYNPIGKSQASYSVRIYDSYVERMHDLDTYLQLVRLQLELRLAKVPTAEIPDFVRTHSPASGSGAPGAEFSWDAQTRLLSFKPYEESFTRFVPASVYVPDPSAQGQ